MNKRVGELEAEVGRLRAELDARFGGITTEKLLEIVARMDKAEDVGASDQSDDESEAEETMSRRLADHPKIKVILAHLSSIVTKTDMI